MFTFLPTADGYVVSDFGPFGEQRFGNPASSTETEERWDIIGRAYPHSPLRFSCVSGLEGPQVVMNWELPKRPVSKIMIRKKKYEYPRDPDDGKLVMEDEATANTATTYTDSTINTVFRVVRKATSVYGVANLVASSQVTTLPGASTTDRGIAANAAIAALNEYFGSSLDLTTLTASGDLSLKNIANLLVAGYLTDTDEPGDCCWWYYRMFVLPTSPELVQQFGGNATQIFTHAATQARTFKSIPIDVQDYPDVDITMSNRSGVAATFEIQGGPERNEADDMWVTIEANIAVGASPNAANRIRTLVTRLISNQSHKYIRVVVQGGSADFTPDAEVVFSVNREVYWQSNSYLSKPCLAYVTGRHLKLIWDGRLLPTMYIMEAATLPPEQLQPLIAQFTPKGWVNLTEDTVPKGPLYRLLKLLTLEMDRDHAYFTAMRKFDLNISEAPESVLKHIAFELGWQVDLDSDLSEVREGIYRAAGLYKHKTTPDLIESVISQTLNIIPRVQEGAGLVLRSANPNLFPKGSSS